MKDMRLVRFDPVFPLVKIKMTPFEPPIRLARDIPELRRSIEERGVLQPVAINEAGELADGNRRVMIARGLGLETIPALIYHAPIAELFATLNLQRAMTPKETAMAYQNSGGRVSGSIRTMRQIEAIEEYCGPEALGALTLRALSPGVWEWVRKLAKYVGEQDAPPFYRAAFFYMVEGGFQYAIRQAMEMHIPPDEIRAVIKERRPIALWSTERVGG